jgi:polyisoprenoid-binding protein YceI
MVDTSSNRLRITVFSIRLPIIAAALSLCALPALADVSKNPQSAPKGVYDLVNRHSLVTYCVVHVGISNYCGWFPKLSGKLHFSGSQPANSELEVTIDLKAVQSRSDELDGRLRDEMFEVAKFPTATFKSTSIKVTGANQGEITGALTLHGVTKPITLKTTFNGGQPSPFGSGHLIGFSAEATVKLADFGLTGVLWKVFVADEVTLRIETEFEHDQ